jgi:DUF1009 family protein
MGRRIGIIAGSGEFPFVVLDEAHKLGYSSVIAGIRGEAAVGLKEKADIFEWIDAGNILSLISFFRKNDIQEAVFAGKVDPRTVYETNKLDESSLKILAQTQERNPTAVIQAIIDFIKGEGIQIVDPGQFIASSFCEEGVMTKTKPSPDVEEDIVFGWKIAKNIADLDIGQTVIVKDKAVVAVEGIEGTDEVIRRGGQLAGKDTVVVKVCRTVQDPRVDLPAVGLNTVKSLVNVQGRALCFESQKVPFFQKEEAVALADENRIAIVVKKS